MTHHHRCFSHALFSQGVLILNTLMDNQRELLTVLQSSPFTYNNMHVKSCCTIQQFYLCSQILPKIPKKKFIFSKVAGLQTATLLKNKFLHKYFSRALTTEEGQLFCRNASVWLLPLQTETQKKTNNNARLQKAVNFNLEFNLFSQKNGHKSL